MKLPAASGGVFNPKENKLKNLITVKTLNIKQQHSSLLINN